MENGEGRTHHSWQIEDGLLFLVSSATSGGTEEARLQDLSPGTSIGGFGKKSKAMNAFCTWISRKTTRVNPTPITCHFARSLIISGIVLLGYGGTFNPSLTGYLNAIQRSIRSMCWANSTIPSQAANLEPGISLRQLMGRMPRVELLLP